LASLTVLQAEVADVQVSRWRGYTGGAAAVLLVRGDVTLATDLSRARFVATDPALRKVVLLLPPPRASAPRIDHERTRVACVCEYGLWRVAPDRPCDAAAARMLDQAYQEAQAIVASAGQDPSLDARARLQAEAVLATFFRSLGWTVTVRWSDRATAPPPHPR
jgi:hypothetical protein